MTSNFAKKTTKIFSSDRNETWYDVRGPSDIHDDMTFKVIGGQGQGQDMTSILCWDYLYFNAACYFVNRLIKHIKISPGYS